jgi:chaperone modulatory protein CbpM
MISIEVVVGQLPGLTRPDLERWITNQWVRPDDDGGTYVFCDIDVARVRLIQELRDDLQVNEEVLPIVLSLLDQLYEQRRRMQQLCDALRRIAPDDVRQKLAQHLARIVM